MLRAAVCAIMAVNAPPERAVVVREDTFPWETDAVPADMELAKVDAVLRVS